jgi:hypothetical protein
MHHGSCDLTFVCSLSDAAAPPLPYDCIANPLNTSVAVIAAEMITWGGGTLNMNPTTNDIAAPTELNGIHLVTAKRALSTIIHFRL